MAGESTRGAAQARTPHTRESVRRMRGSPLVALVERVGVGSSVYFSQIFFKAPKAAVTSPKRTIFTSDRATRRLITRGSRSTRHDREGAYFATDASQSRYCRMPRADEVNSGPGGRMAAAMTPAPCQGRYFHHGECCINPARIIPRWRRACACICEQRQRLRHGAALDVRCPEYHMNDTTARVSRWRSRALALLGAWYCSSSWQVRNSCRRTRRRSMRRATNDRCGDQHPGPPRDLRRILPCARRRRACDAVSWFKD